jgi:hypothetical protein
VIGIGDRLERAARMAHLTPGSATTLATEGLGDRFGQSIGGGRFAAVAAVERQPVFEFLELAAQFVYLRFQLQDQPNEHVETALG